MALAGSFEVMRYCLLGQVPLTAQTVEPTVVSSALPGLRALDVVCIELNANVIQLYPPTVLARDASYDVCDFHSGIIVRLWAGLVA